MDKFEGFTEEEIKNLTSAKQRSSDDKIPSTAVYKNLQNKSRHQNRLPRKNVARERLLKGNYNTFTCSMTESLPKEARLHIPEIPEEEEEYETEDTKNRNSQNPLSEMKTNTSQKENATKDVENKNAGTQSNISTENTVASSKSDESSKVSDSKMDQVETTNIPLPLLNSRDADIDALEQFETRQKLMEEQNRQKKEILKRALADRTKKTHEEVKRLNEIEGELKKLDLLLSNDVSIIRNQIESASIDFMEAQKRFDKAEKEFLDAKLDLFNKKERKELLTSHLCTIIEQNEMRKAKKLSDLMMQLEVGPKSSLITSQINVEYKVKDQQQDTIQLHGDKKVEEKLNVKNERENLKLTEVKEGKEENEITNS